MLRDGQSRIELDEVHLGSGARLSIPAPAGFDAVSSRSVRSTLVVGNMTGSGGSTSQVVVRAGTTVVLSGVQPGMERVGRRSLETWSGTSSGVESSWLEEEVRRSSVMQPLLVNAASVQVQQHGRLVAPSSVVVRDASLDVQGELVGVRGLVVDEGGVVGLGSTGGTWVNDSALTAGDRSGWSDWVCGVSVPGTGHASGCASSSAGGAVPGRYGFGSVRLEGSGSMVLSSGVSSLVSVSMSMSDQSRMSLGVGSESQVVVEVRDELDVGAGATIDGAGAGYTGDSHHSSCFLPGTSGGGLHGGGPVDQTCGDFEWPVLAGSGGRTGTPTGGAGGGSLLLLANSSAASTVRVDGVVSVDGADGISNLAFRGIASGGGAGGSVLVVASQLSGSGMIRANGGGGADGYTSSDSYPGSGGRIATHATVDEFVGSLYACSGAPFV